MWMIPKVIIGMYLICMACIQVIKYPHMRILGFFIQNTYRCFGATFKQFLFTPL